MKKRKLPPHIVLPDGRWRFVKKGYSSHRQTNPSLRKSKVVKVARFRRTRRAARAVYSRGRRGVGLGGGWKGMIAPLAGGAGDVIAQKYIPINGVASTIAGMFLHDPVTMKIGLNKAGESLGMMFAGGGGGNGGGGWI
jgi:hypothetical protein